MIPYIKCSFSINQLCKALLNRRLLCDQFIVSVTNYYKNCSVHVRKFERDALTAILNDIGWKNKTIAIPAYTCDSMLASIEASGNHVFVYNVSEYLQIDEDIDWDEIDALLVSHVYAIKIQIPITVLEKRIVVIADLAHNSNFYVPDYSKYDILLFSSAYYKPIKSSGFGLGIVKNDYFKLKNSIFISYSFIPNLLVCIKLFLIQILIRSSISKPLYKQSLFGSQKRIRIDPNKINNSAMALSPSLVRLFNWEGMSIQMADFYKTEIKKIHQLKFLTEDIERLTYVPIICNSINRNELIIKMLQKNYLLGRVFSYPAGYDISKNKSAIFIADHIANLPICTTKTEAIKLFDALKECCEQLGES